MPFTVHGQRVTFTAPAGASAIIGDFSDGTDRPIATELERAGIPKEDIVLAEQHPDLRPHTGYAVG